MKKTLKWIGIVIATPFVLLLLLNLLIYLPPVQKYLVNKAVNVASKELGLQVSIDDVRLSFPMDLVLTNFVAIQNQDTVLAVGKLTADIQVLPLIRQVVNIDGLDLRDVKVNTLDLIDAVDIKGTLPHFYLKSHGINWGSETIVVNEALIDGADICITVNDSVPEDTVPSEPTAWQVLLEKARIKSSDLRVLVDSMDICLGFGDSQVSHTTMDLGESLFKVAHLVIQSSSASVNLIPGFAAQGFDYNHISLDSLNLVADSLVNQGSFVSVNLLKSQFKERSGLQAKSLTGRLRLDSASIKASKMSLVTPYSGVNLDAAVDWSSLDKAGDGLMELKMDATIGKQDLLLAVGEENAKKIRDAYPDAPIIVNTKIDGNMHKIQIHKSKASLDGILVSYLDGAIYNVLNDKTRSGSINLNAQADNLKPFLKAVNLSDYTVPQGMKAMGHVNISGTQYSYEGKILERNGVLDLSVHYDDMRGYYKLDANANQINLHDFMPKDSLFLVSGNISVQGTGTDFYSRHSIADIQAKINSVQYKTYEISGIGLQAKLDKNRLTGRATSDNPYLHLESDFDALVKKDTIGGDIFADVLDADLTRLGVMGGRGRLSLKINANLGYNFGENANLNANISNISLEGSKDTYHLKDFNAQAFLTSDSIKADVVTGNLIAHLRTAGGLSHVQKQGQEFINLLQSQIKEHNFQIPVLKEAIPQCHLEIRAGKDNLISNILQLNGYDFGTLYAHFDTSVDEGLHGNMHVYSFKSDSLQLDTIRLNISPEEETLRFRAQIRNNRNNPQFVFNSYLNGSLMNDGVVAHLQLYDKKDVLGIDMGFRMKAETNGFRFTFSPERPLLAYNSFNLSPDDAYVFLRDDMQVSGNMSLLTDEGMGIVFSANPNEGEQQNMDLEVFDLNLTEISNILPYVPEMSGLVSGKIHAYQQAKGDLQANGKLNFKNLTYEENPMGDIDLAMEYTPSSKGMHSVSMTLERNGVLVSQLSGSYESATGDILLDAELIRFPAEIVNGFIPDHLFGLKGTLEGKFKLTGDTSRPIVNGTIGTDSVYLFSDVYNLNLRAQNKKFPIVDSRFSMQNFVFYSEKNDELTANGTIDFANLDKILMNISLRARNFQLIDEPRNMVSQLYGKAFVNLQTTVRGDLDNLVVRGTVELLGTTDVTYVLKDSPLEIEDRLSDLVTFIDFADTTKVQQEISRQELSGVDLQLNLNISEGAHVNCDLSVNRESYVMLQGGGNLVFRYTPEGKMLLNGRYNINGGEMKYDLQVIPLKTFTLGSGSYVQFNGDIQNPTLNITATEKTRASVTTNGSSPRNVLFEVGVKISQTLQNMGLEFTIDALQDMTVQNDLAGFSKETRAKLAVTMLVTGLYLSEENASGNINMSSALNSFLQSEISSIAGNALRTIDISVGMEDGTASDGSATTDYSFRFAKRLWNNRVSIIIGGKVSTGSNANASDSFIDDVSIEYRLDENGTRYIRLYHERNYDSLLDGDVIETGGGIVLRKKVNRFDELFIFRSRKKREQLMQERELRREQRLEQRRNEANNE